MEQWRVLSALAQDSGQPMGALARNVFMNHPALTKLVDKMVANGLIHRVVDPADQRRVLVHNTDRGTALLGRLQGIVDSHQRGVEQAFGLSRTAALDILLEELAENDLSVYEVES